MSALFWKRVYKPASREDGYRILVDRLWPRGLKKERAALDNWSKLISPSTALRQAYHQGVLDYDSFAADYEQELEHNPYFEEFTTLIKDHLKNGNVTLVYSSKEPKLSHIPTLQAHIEKESGIKSVYSD
ncbi:DUF488 domain-containing protein [Parasporobacterium paucivorans]|uniref:Uncharacterized conserved protein YeaO, DUF488 family n=1 Tax=Parasporobacterium paucivorans DSM 15970 TaxID=1122934 RepID=A0A1M6LQ75_9FIRM|nr:DUF488 family protein [Parasporobacterium paucivorans]SHJ73320.1 Uncharacterized conserved protein YeaO, DUF488 family [Parasporobacterium paucivorans DSM 15970]